MAKVWAIVEVLYTQTNAWVMVVWAKVVGQVNGLFAALLRGGRERKRKNDTKSR